MKVMVMIKATNSSEQGELPSAELLTAMGNYNQELVNAGIVESGDGLKPSSEGFRVRFSGEKRDLTQGPFTETNELIAGYWIWNVSSMEEALAWVKKCPNPMTTDSEIEVRPFYTMDDFAEVSSSEEVLAQEEKMRQQLASSKTQVNNYLFFSGNCEKALNFYQQALGVDIHFLMRFSESPEPLPDDLSGAEYKNKIMHGEFSIGKTKFLASDGCGDGTQMSGFSLALTLETAEEANAIFAALAKEGKVNMPLAETFWSPLYGQVTDKFGVDWMVMLPGNEA
ncbi:YciI family protein [Thalassotalea agariperforans]